MTDALVAFVAALAAMAVIDGVWLGLVARTFYRRHLGPLMADRPNWTAAVAFYLLYVVGVTVFAVLPAADSNSLLGAAWRGGLFGLVAYATYDLTNAATLRGWPGIVVVVDMAWGMMLTASVATTAAGVVLLVTG
ncbi:MAG TPA: DUF2177 family protein [Candidatus Limnocylindria bacterium]|jgi:uncharacterized membrane protein